MATSVLSSPVTSSLPITNTQSAVSPEIASASAKNEIFTVDDLLQTRATGETAHEPIVAYPSSGTEYIYYTPHQVRCFGL